MSRSWSSRLAWFGAALALGACSSKVTGAVQLTTGGESDTFTRSPAPTTLVVDGIDADGGVTNLARAQLPTDNVDLGDRSQDAIYSVRVQGVDSTGKVLVDGMSLPVQLGAISGGTLPIFVQRVGELARLPAPLTDARERPDVTLILGRYALVTGGSQTPSQSALYDLGSLSPFGQPPLLPRTPKSLLPYGTEVLIVDDGGATWFSLSDSTSSGATAPTGGTFAEVVGGHAVLAPDGSAYLVGGTRSDGGATARVLKVSSDGTLSFVSLVQARLGATATWVPGRGLVVAGGSAEGAGVELLAPGATSATALPYPADPVTLAGAAALDGSHVVLAGGTAPAASAAPTRVVDLGCSATCTPTTWAALPTSLTFAQAFTLGATAALVSGDDASGASHVFFATPTAATEVPFKIGRRGARGVSLTSGSVLFAGGSPTLEQFSQ